LTAINKALIAKYPTRTVYINACPKDFARPSFLLEYVRASADDESRNTVSVTMYYTVTIFEAVDAHYHSDSVVLMETQDAVLGLFRGGYLTVTDRKVKMKSSAGGLDTDRAYVDLQFEYFDDRTDTDAEEGLPLMSTVETKIQEG